MLALAIGLALAVLFIALASRNIEAQGLYQDEALQASGSFAYVGGSSIGAMSIFGVPVLNNSYLGAIKTGIYGFYMRIAGRPFTIFSWRILGVLAVALGLIVFCALSYRALGLWPLLLGTLLAVTDGTAIVMTRHDWGPTALALLIRLALIAMLLRNAPDGDAARRNSFAVGALVGIGVFEKLSSLALLAPVALAIALQPFRRSRRALAALVIGGLAGGFPLIAVNTISLVRDHTLISFADTDSSLRPPLKEFVREFPRQFLALGAGAGARERILGDADSAVESRREMVLVAALLALTLAVSAWKFRGRPEFRTAAVLALSVFGVAAALYALPRLTGLHHHIQATPFAYIAGACVLAGMLRLKTRRLAENAAAAAVAVVMLLLLANHAAAVGRIESDFAQGRTGVEWDRRFTDLGSFGASHRNDAIFIFTDWGVSNAIVCLSQAPPQLAHEVFWNYKGPQELEHLAEAYHRPWLYLVTPTRTGINPEMAARINRDASLVPNWKEMSPEPETAALRPLILVRKFEYRPPSR